MVKAINVSVRGRVQGVGFRPFVFGLAEKYHLNGTVQNNMDGVKIHLEGEDEQLRSFLRDLETNPPRLSKIHQIIVFDAEVNHCSSFSIIPSERKGTSMLVIPIDSAVCDDCLEEMRNPEDFRYRYPFINCTQCGPRYSIIRELPYDRPFTTMDKFTMCPDCQAEYDNPLDRRHHAQPIACPKCGPKAMLYNAAGDELTVADPIEEAISLLKAGKILAIKGIGGYHLCCDARNQEAVGQLPSRKSKSLRLYAVRKKNCSRALKRPSWC
jgi:hydrogenase maturation protein HypF